MLELTRELCCFLSGLHRSLLVSLLHMSSVSVAANPVSCTTTPAVFSPLSIRGEPCPASPAFLFEKLYKVPHPIFSLTHTSVKRLSQTYASSSSLSLEVFPESSKSPPRPDCPLALLTKSFTGVGSHMSVLKVFHISIFYDCACLLNNKITSQRCGSLG